MRDTLKNRFSPFLNEAELRAAIELVCGEFGKVSNLKIFPASKDQSLNAICFLQLDSPAAEAALLDKLEAIRFAEDIVFTVDLAEEWSGARK